MYIWKTRLRELGQVYFMYKINWYFSAIKFCRSKNCTEIWEKFSMAFVDKEPCNLPEESFDEFVDVASHPLPPDTVTFI